MGVGDGGEQTWTRRMTEHMESCTRKKQHGRVWSRVRRQRGEFRKTGTGQIIMAKYAKSRRS